MGGREPSLWAEFLCIREVLGISVGCPLVYGDHSLERDHQQIPM